MTQGGQARSQESLRGHEDLLCLLQSLRRENLGVVIGDIAHDFNNLLVSILGNASMLQEMPLSPQRALPLADDIVQASERAAQFLKRLLAYTGKASVASNRVNLSERAKALVDRLCPALPANVELRLELEEALPEAQADASQIWLVALNLLINAVESIGDDSGQVTLQTGLAPEGVFLEVRDNGCGMDEETQAHAFEPFFSTKAAAGRGLGLPAVRRIVRAHKGTLTVSSAPGLGSAFRVTFPAIAPRI